MKNDPIICVVDGYASAMILSILLKNKDIDVCIIEEKNDDFDTDEFLIHLDRRLAINMLLSTLRIKYTYSVWMPCIWFPSRNKVSKWVKYYQVNESVKRFLESLPVDYHTATIMGAVTSTVMAFVPCNQVIPIDHGMEVLRRITPCNREEQKNSFLKKYIKNFLKKITSFNEWNFEKRGYTLANCPDDFFYHVDYRDFENGLIEQALFKGIQRIKCENLRAALVLPPTQGEYRRQLKHRGDLDSECNMLDFEAVYSGLLHQQDDINCVVIKFHPAFYAMERNAEKFYMDVFRRICDERGIKCLTLDELLGNAVGWSLPVEVIVRYIPIKKIITMHSTALVNIASKDNSVKCVSVIGLIKEFDEDLGDFSLVNPNVHTVHENLYNS